MLSSVGLLNDLEVMRIVIISYSCKQKKHTAGTNKFTLSHTLNNIYTCSKLSKYLYTSLNTLYYVLDQSTLLQPRRNHINCYAVVICLQCQN